MISVEAYMVLYSVDDVEIRTYRIRDMIHNERMELLNSFREKYQSVITKKKIRYTCPNEYLEVDLKKYLTISDTIINTYMPMMMQDIFIMTMSDDDITRQLADFKDNLNKCWNNLYRLLSKQDDAVIQWEELDRCSARTRRNSIKREGRGKGRNCKLPSSASMVMQRWLMTNFENPYPSQATKVEMAKEAKIGIQQVNNWFINARYRIIKRFTVGSRKKLHKERYRIICDSDSEIY